MIFKRLPGIQNVAVVVLPMVHGRFMNTENGDFTL